MSDFTSAGGNYYDIVFGGGSMSDQFSIEWMDRGSPPRVEPNPAYPDGCYLDLTETALRIGETKLAHPSMASNEKSCVVALPYPSGHENVGTWIVKCRRCGMSVGVTAASRVDDARSVRLPCKVGTA